MDADGQKGTSVGPLEAVVTGDGWRDFTKASDKLSLEAFRKWE